VDLDHFRTINDALGHDVGDCVLRELAMRLNQPYLDEATVVRLGGDEFALVLSALMDCELARPRAEHVAGEIRRRLEVPLSLGFQVGAHIGIACIDGGCESELDVLRHAEMALYEAKAGRRQVTFYEPAMQESTHARMQLMHGLRGAWERGELALEFQPQCDAAGTVRGAEALVRWFHPEHGCIPPDCFIGLAEESGLIHPIGEWVFDRASAVLAGWKRDGLSLRGRLAVNISGWQLAHPGFVGMVCKTLERHAVDPTEVTLEVTETMLLADAEDTIGKLSQLRATGLHVSMDDFGTGYSSLAQLHRVPLDEIKIDKSFVDGMLRSERAKLLVETIVSVGRRLQLTVVAEGVETQEQHLMLMDAGCDVFQGYLYGRAMPEATFRDWLTLQARVQESTLRFRVRGRATTASEAEAPGASASGVAAIAYFGA
jgi:diguanylate cyclase (GGDEF)-like protein